MSDPTPTSEQMQRALEINLLDNSERIYAIARRIATAEAAAAAAERDKALAALSDLEKASKPNTCPRLECALWDGR